MAGPSQRSISSLVHLYPQRMSKSLFMGVTGGQNNMKWYLKVLKNYAVFNGRARRQEYWMFVLFNFIAGFLLAIIEGILGGITNTDQSVLTIIYQLAIIIPSIAVSIRRMHDTNHSGWWIIVPIVGFIFTFLDGTPGENQYGLDPKS
jgi:uncharacterized membrane protein YhaH (DUF805 family)